MGELVQLGKIGAFATGGTPSRKHDEYFHGDIPWVSTVALNGGHIGAADAQQMITNEAIQHSATKLIPAGSIFVGIRVGVGKVAITDVPMCSNQDIVAISDIDTSEWDIDYLCYAIQSQSQYLASQKQGATISGISSKLLKSVEIEHPSLLIQKAIVRNLNAVRAQIDLAKQMLSKADELIQSRFVEMFGVIDAGYFPLKKVEDLVVNSKNALKAGPFGSALKKDSYTEAGYAVYGQEQVISGNENGILYHIPQSKYDQLSSCRVCPGDVLISLVGTAGKVLVLSEDCEEGVINPRLVKITFNQEVMLPEFFAILFARDDVQAVLRHYSHGQTMNVLNLKMIRSLAVPVPPLMEQRRFLEFVTKVEELKSTTQAELDRLNTLYDSLAQRYFA